MIFYKIGNLWNFDSFPYCKILKICYFSKLYTTRKFNDFRRRKIREIFGIVQIEHF